MPDNKMDIETLKRRVEKEFGDRLSMLFHHLCFLTISNQPCDICICSGKPHLNVKVDSNFMVALMYGAGAEILVKMLNEIKLNTGKTVSINDIWVINPMPIDGITKEQLDKVDISDGEKVYGPNGETLKEMIRNTYHCKDEEEVDSFLRRFLAS